MNLLVCVKVVADLDLSSRHRWEIENNQVDFTFYKKQLNCYDAAALELALRAKKSSPETHVTALTVSDGADLRFLKPLYAIGVDACVQLPMEGDLRFSPQRVASGIVGWAKETRPEFILFGSQQSVGQNGVTGLAASHLLGWNCYTRVMGFEPLADGQMRISYQADDALITRTVAPPAVLILSDAVTCLLHTPTMKEKLASASRLVITLETAPPKDAALPAPVFTGLTVPTARGLCRMLAPDTAAKEIYKAFLEGRERL